MRKQYVSLPVGPAVDSIEVRPSFWARFKAWLATKPDHCTCGDCEECEERLQLGCF